MGSKCDRSIPKISTESSLLRAADMRWRCECLVAEVSRIDAPNVTSSAKRAGAFLQRAQLGAIHSLALALQCPQFALFRGHPQYRALFVPITEDDPLGRLAVQIEVVNGGAVRMAVNEVSDTCRTQGFGNRTGVYVHDGFVSTVRVCATVLARFGREGAAGVQRHGQHL